MRVDEQGLSCGCRSRMMLPKWPIGWLVPVGQRESLVTLWGATECRKTLSVKSSGIITRLLQPEPCLRKKAAVLPSG